MRSLVTLVIAFLSFLSLSAQVDFTARVVADRLRIPWDLQNGPDGRIWYTERQGIVSTVDMETGERDTLLDFTSGVEDVVEAGLLGMAIHPQFDRHPYVFLSYIFPDSNIRVKRVARYRYNGTKLVDPTVIYELRPAQQWHQGCRMIILPDTTLMFTNGDQPSPDSTFSLTSEIGKVIRINLDGSIPTDNPYPNSRIWSVGHRNPQGLCQLPNGLIYSSEHGDITEDEINLIEKGANYGWPKVEGFCNTPQEITFCEANNVHEPAWSTGPITLAPSGLEYYHSDRYPRLRGKLLSVFLKAARLTALSLSDDQRAITGFEHFVPYRYGRLRDVLVTPDGRVFLCTGNAGYKYIEPFPKPADDVIIELLPVWEATPSKVVAQQDTVVIRANPGDSVKTAMTFCSDGTTAYYRRFETNPGNIFQSRFWQDDASTEDTTCYPFKVLFTPEWEFPYQSRATVWYDRPGGGSDSTSGVFLGLPSMGWAHSPADTVDFIEPRSITCTIMNIGLQEVMLTGVSFSAPDFAWLAEQLVLPQVLEPGASISFLVDASPLTTLGQTIDVLVSTSSDQTERFTLRRVLTLNVASDASTPAVQVAPNPASDVVRIDVSAWAAASDGVRVTMHDMLGRVTFDDTFNGSVISIPTSRITATSGSSFHTVTVESGTHRRSTSVIIVR